MGKTKLIVSGPVTGSDEYGLTKRMLASEAAEILGVTRFTVRTFAEAGLLSPVRTRGGWRLFDSREVVDLARARMEAERKRVQEEEERLELAIQALQESVTA